MTYVDDAIVVERDAVIEYVDMRLVRVGARVVVCGRLILCVDGELGEQPRVVRVRVTCQVIVTFTYKVRHVLLFFSVVFYCFDDMYIQSCACMCVQWWL